MQPQDCWISLPLLVANRFYKEGFHWRAVRTFEAQLLNLCARYTVQCLRAYSRELSQFAIKCKQLSWRQRCGEAHHYLTAGHIKISNADVAGDFSYHIAALGTHTGQMIHAAVFQTKIDISTIG